MDKKGENVNPLVYRIPDGWLNQAAVYKTVQVKETNEALEIGLF